MQISKSYEYPASPAEVALMVGDPTFQARKCEATHPLSHSESVTPKGDQTEIVTIRVMPTDSFPDMLKSMVGPKIRVTETYVWSPAGPDGSRTGTVEVAIGDGSLPVGMKGTVSLKPSGAGSVVHIEGDLKARVPLLGGKIEKAAGPSIIDAIDREHEVGLAWLAR
ncbi:MAG: DUF2505 domain-containing protein [Lapillicoccus sp.]